jgi:hypothetical protein
MPQTESLSCGNVFINFHSFTDGPSAHFKNNASIFNLTHHKADSGLDTCWTFTATGHGKGAGDGIGAVLKSTARCMTLAKNIFLSSPKDFYEFSREQQLQTAQANGKEDPAVHIFFLDAREVEQAKDTTIKQRVEQIKSSGNVSFLSVLNSNNSM